MRGFENESEIHARSIREAEETLRLIARQSAPEGLTERVHRRLQQDLAQQHPARSNEPRRAAFWRLWLPAHRLQFAGAGVLAGVIAVSMLSVRHTDRKAPQAAVPVPVQGGAFGTSAAQGRPATLTPIPVPAASAKKKKPSAGHGLKHAAKPAVAGEASATPVVP